MSPEKRLLESRPFSCVLAAELDAIRKRREFLRDPDRKGEVEEGVDTPPPAAPAAAPVGGGSASLEEIKDQKTRRLDALKMHLAGLAISGGGIRSATFALGLLQGLAELDILKHFDYISTVSGGGYIGSWLAAWTKREGDVDNVYRQLCSRRDDQSRAHRPPLPRGSAGVVDEEPEPVHHLRSYSNYLAPHRGLVTPDTWSLFAIYGRNLLINFLILLPATVFLVTLVRLAVVFFRAPNASFVSHLQMSAFTRSFVLSFAAVGALSLRGGAKREARPFSRARRVLVALIIAWCLASLLTRWPIHLGGLVGLVGQFRVTDWSLPLGMSFVFLIALAIVFNVIGLELYKMQKSRNRRQTMPETPTYVKVVAGVTFLALAAAVVGGAAWYRETIQDALNDREWALPFLLAMVVILVFSALFYGVAQAGLKPARTSPAGAYRPIGIYRLICLVIIPLFLSAVLSCWLFSIDPVSEPGRDAANLDASHFKTRLEPLGYKVLIAPFDPPGFLAGLGLESPRGGQEAFEGWRRGKFYWWPASFLIGFFAFMHGVAHLFINWIVVFRLLLDERFVDKSPPFSLRRLKILAILVLAPFLSGAVGGLLFFILVVKGLWAWHHLPHALVTFGPPLALLLFTVAASLEIGLLGRRLEEDEREWWARVGALALLAGTVWVLLFAAALYVPWLIELAGDYRRQLWVKSGLTVGWLVTSVGGALAGRSAATNGGVKGVTAREVLAQVAPWVFLVGLLAGVSLLVGHGVDVPPSVPGLPHDHWAEVDLARLSSLASWCAGSALFALVMSNLVDVNLFSLHNMYANRLIRCYLGASRKKKAWANRWGMGVRPVDRCGSPTNSQGNDREENPISGFDFDDDIPLLELNVGHRSPRLNLPVYWGPFPLINTALNLVATRELDWQERKAESFVLSPLYCGGESVGYQRLPDDFRRGNMTLGRAMAISGAAADPNMGHHASTPVTALMTIFNTRLGWWIENPSRPLGPLETAATARWAAESPSYGGLILKELAGQTDSTGPWVHLSDGGHFENLGAYELIRRRCRYVVVSDGGCDPGLAFEDLANLIRKCRTDFGIRIEIDTAPIRKEEGPAGGPSRWHCAVGKIRYDDVDGGEVPGILVYVKSSLTGDEPPDVQEYARRDPTFPHQTTADQFFDETQFESYRALGYHVARDVFGDARVESPAPAGSEEAMPRVFSRLRNRWFPAPPELEANFEKVAEAFDKLHQAMRSDPNLRAFTHDLYPELGPLPGPGAGGREVDPADRACAELHAVNQVALLMEKAWIAVKLEGFPEHPMNRGWMNQFRRCASSATLRRFWPALRAAFSQEFVKFCEQELMLAGELPGPVPFATGNDAHDRAYSSLREEFGREWPAELPSLDGSVAACRWSRSDAPRSWLILDGDPEPFAYGIALRLPAGCRGGRPVHEVVLWVRPAHRNLRIGQKCFRQLFEGNPGAILRARYPKASPGGEKVRVELWKFFHFSRNFRPVEGDPTARVLERHPPGET